MEARTRRPVLGSAALCATFVCLSFQTALAQYGRPAIYSPQPTRVASPADQQPYLPPIAGNGRSGARGMVGQSMNGAMNGAGQSANFIVLCNDPQLAQTVSDAAEELRRDLAVHWLGQELPTWSRRCPIHVHSAANLGAGGETRFSLYNGNVGDWNMTVQGTTERILDSVLPHEITHTILASHFAPLNTHVPRWADEGACTTVEHSSEQAKHESHLVQFLTTGRGLSFNRMFTLKDYPKDILPLYAQGHSVVEFLIAQGGPRKFVEFLETGMQSQNWETAIQSHYDYETLGQLQIRWNQWIADGRGTVDAYVATPQSSAIAGSLASTTTGGNIQLASGSRPSTAIAPAGKAATLSVPSLDAVAASAEPASASREGSAVSLEAASLDAKGVSQIEGVLTPVPPASLASTAAVADKSSGFYRQRLESNLRDIVPNSPQATTAAAASPGQLAIEPVSQRATSRPQPAQPTPTRVLEAGLGAAPGRPQPLYR